MLTIPSWTYFTNVVFGLLLKEKWNDMARLINDLAHRAGFIYSKLIVTQLTGDDEQM